MKKYYLNPLWDIIPREDSLEFSPLGSGENFSVDKNLLPLLNGLIQGSSDAPQELKSHGAVTYAEEPQPIPENNYLDLLKNHCLNLGGILPVSALCDSPSEHLHIAYTLGFGPRFILHQSSLISGWGADKDPVLAQIKAAVEGIERYALGEYNSPHPTTLREIRGTKELVLPIDSLYHPVDYTELGRKPVAPLNISGVAGHQSLEAAQVNALLELCEHEALMVAWFSQRKTSSIMIKSLDKNSQEIVHELKKMGWNIIIKDISLDIVPAAMAIAIGPKGKRALTIGSSAAFSLRYAAMKALTEVARTILVDELIKPDFPLLKREEVDDIATHATYYARHEHLNEAAFLWAEHSEVEATDFFIPGNGRLLSETKVEWEASNRPEIEEMNYLVGLMQKAVVVTYSKDITPQSIKKAEIPLCVVRTVAPEMATLTVGYGQKPAPTKRFQKLTSNYGAGFITNPNNSLTPFS